MTANENFFYDKKAAAVLKHGVLKRYLAKFSGATSSGSEGRKVAYIDGYAGEGEYTNPRTNAVSEGSPAIALRIARDQAAFGINLYCTFVEKDLAAFTSLNRLVSSSGVGTAVALCGEASAHLDAALERSSGMPALVFIDPFGRGPDVETTVKTILSRAGDHPTELLLNLSVQSIRRIGARIWEPEGTQGREKTLANLDDWMGGAWWRDIYLSDEIKAEQEGSRPHLAATSVAQEYIRRIAHAAGRSAYTVPIRRKPSDKEIFWLVLFCPRTLALWHFNETVSLALEDWRSFLADVELSKAERDDADSPGLFPVLPELQRVIAADEAQIHRDAIEDIKASIRAVLEEKDELSTRNDLSRIFGVALGIGRQKHLRAAWKELAAEGVTNAVPTGDLGRVTIRSA